MSKIKYDWNNKELLEKAAKKEYFIDALKVIGIKTIDPGSSYILKFEKECKKFNIDISHINKYGSKLKKDKVTIIEKDGYSKFKVFDSNFVKLGEVVEKNKEFAENKFRIKNDILPQIKLNLV